MRCFFGGSRSLPSSAAPLVSSVVSAALASGASLSVGCCAGADQLALLAVLAAGAGGSLSVFAVGSAAGAGFAASLSAPLSLLLAAQAAGASVSWLAGGSLAVPLRARLVRRSRAAAAGSDLAVLFAPGRGSLAAAAPLAASGVPVFAVGGQPAPFPALAGGWVVSSVFGLLAWRWLPGQTVLF
jgi:hypothetical protein